MLDVVCSSTFFTVATETASHRTTHLNMLLNAKYGNYIKLALFPGLLGLLFLGFIHNTTRKPFMSMQIG